MIHDFVYGKFGSERAQRIVPCVKRLLTEARKNGMPAIFLRDAHRKGDKELEVWGEHAMKGTKGSEIIPEIAPQNGDYVFLRAIDDAISVTHRKDDAPPCPKCGTQMELVERMLSKNGKRTEPELTPRELRMRVLRQLEKLELEPM
jgi:hypothetical protein